MLIVVILVYAVLIVVILVYAVLIVVILVYAVLIVVILVYAVLIVSYAHFDFCLYASCATSRQEVHCMKKKQL